MTRAWIGMAAALVIADAVVRITRARARRTAGGRRFFSHRAAAPALGLLSFVVVLALAAPLVTPFGPSIQLDIVHAQHLPPSWAHPLGTDLYSRDVWSRLVYGARVSLAIGTLAALLATTAGTLVGALAGYWRRWVDAGLMRVVDVGLGFPRIFLFLAIVALTGPLPLWGLVSIIGLTGWFATSRLVRAEVLSIGRRPYVDAVHALGARPGRVLARHVLPNVLAPVIVSTALGVGHVMLLEAGLSFLGAGVAPPTPTWGSMIANGADHVAKAPWTTVAPGLAIALVVAALNALGDALRDALDPRLEP